MTSVSAYPKRLIEVDLPIKKISEHARREKSIRHGHISTLHIWWARRPLAACRAVICAALWPDPADPLCPESFKAEAKMQMGMFWNTVDTTARNVDDRIELRKALLDFIADFSNWDNSTDERYLTTARKLTQSAHEALGGKPGTRPLVVDPFAGGGSIPLEALRVGADAYASDLNPVAVLLNKVVLEYIPQYGQELADEVRKWGLWVKEEAEKELAEYYPKDQNGATSIAYLWTRTITCEGPGCGAEVPLIRSLWLAKKGNNSVAFRLTSNIQTKQIDFEIIENAKLSDVKDGTMKRGSVTCPCCNYTTPVTSVRKQLNKRHGGADDARMIAVRYDIIKTGARTWRLSNLEDLAAYEKAANKLEKNKKFSLNELNPIPNETLPIMSGVFNAPIYGHTTWGSLFNKRQVLCLIIFSRLVNKIPLKSENGLDLAVRTCLGLAIDRLADYNASLCVLNSTGGRGLVHVFGRQALPMIWDYMETNPFNTEAANWQSCTDVLYDTIQNEKNHDHLGIVELANAVKHPLPNDSIHAFITDPPYYNAVPYADLSDFFYVWLKRTIGSYYPELFSTELTEKNNEICEMAGWDSARYSHKNGKWFENEMAKAMKEGCRLLVPNGIGVVVFAHKSTSGWEAQLQAMIDAGWIIVGSWPIDTERPGRLRAQNSAALASSIHLVCRTRENPGGTLREEIGDWQDVLAELPVRIHEWMPRLKEENVVGADAIFACLGPALEIFSRYSRVERASGEQVRLKEYLEKVWETVENEALKVIFDSADTSGFEEDARLTAMWLWTLKSGANGDSKSQSEDLEGESEDDTDETVKSKSLKISGYGLEYDAVHKISQGLGTHPEEMPSLIEIKKGNARLLSVAERAPYLFGKQDLTPKRKLKKRDAQLTLSPGEMIPEETTVSSSLAELTTIGKTTLDRVHQSMLLFGNGQSEVLKRFLVEEGIGKDPQFKKLAQALVALYPSGSDEKRLAEGVMNRMKGLGL
jgi:putative DNA methylase